MTNLKKGKEGQYIHNITGVTDENLTREQNDYQNIIQENVLRIEGEGWRQETIHKKSIPCTLEY